MASMQQQAQTRPSLAMPEQALGRQTVIQRSSLTGFRHHAAPSFWAGLRDDSILTLSREADNPHDPDAVALYWKGWKLGYLPKGENFLVARLLDSNRNLSARIERLQPRAHRNRRVQVAVILH